MAEIENRQPINAPIPPTFPTAGGEMGNLMRAFDWEHHPLGSVGTWPQSLRTTLSILLHSKFPMFLFWGPELRCFYNDAYRPSLGNDGKHPHALGEPGETVWPEIWPTIKPLIDQVLSGGEATWSEDQLLPIYRNGRLEDVYWTFSYSPVIGESGQPEGVFVTCTETTKTVNVFQQLRLSEQRFQNLIQQATVGMIVLIGEEMRVEIVNDAFGRLIDRRPEELLHQPLFQIIPETEPAFRPILDQVRQSGEPRHLYNHPYFVHVAEQKKEGYLDLVYQPYREGDDTPTGVMVLCHDVTEQVKARQKVEESAEQLQHLANAMPQIVWMADGEGHVLYYNDRVAEFAGAKQMPDGRWRWEGILHPDDQAATSDAWNKAVAEKSVYEKEHRLLKADGSFRWHLSRAFPVLDEAGNATKWYGTATDVHRQKQTEAALLESEERFRKMADNVPVMIWVTQPDGACTYLNEKWYAYTGQAPIENPDLDWTNAIHPDDAEMAGKLFMEANAQQTQFRLTYRLRRRDGRYHWCLDIGLPKFNQAGEYEGFVGAVLDIHEQKMAEDALFRLSKKMAAANRDLAAANQENQTRNEELATKNVQLLRTNTDLDNFVYTASHDLKAPIVNIEGLIHALLRNLGTKDSVSERTQHIASLILDSVERFKRTIGHLTEVVKLQQAHTGQETVVPLLEVIREVLLDLHPMMEAVGAQVIVDVEEDTTVHFMAKHVRSVVYNLLSNAIKYGSPDRTPQIRIACENTPGYQVLSISDNGLGIDDKRIGQLFTMFRRFHDHVEGAGVGLYMVKKIIESAGGRIEVESQVDQGSTFRVYFRE